MGTGGLPATTGRSQPIRVGILVGFGRGMPATILACEPDGGTRQQPSSPGGPTSRRCARRVGMDAECPSLYEIASCDDPPDRCQPVLGKPPSSRSTPTR